MSLLPRALLWVGLCAAPLAQAAYTVNADGTVTDTITGLVWDRCAYGLTGATCVSGSAFYGTWANALNQASAANTAAYKGFSDWRVPNKNELESIVKIDAVSPAIDSTAFPNTPVSDYFWTSSTYTPYPAYAWVVNFGYGGTNAYDETYNDFVRLVRSGQSFAPFDGLLPVVNGSCGSAHPPTPLVTSAPSTNLCGVGSTASGVTSGTSSYTWSCVGSNGGSTASCSAGRGYTVTSSAGANGSISGAQVAAYNATPAFTATPATGYAVNAWAGSCGGTASGTGNVNYTTHAVTQDCTVLASFIGNDTTPDAFSFTAASNAALGTVQTSNAITVAGLTTGASISISGGEYRINSGSFVSTAGTVNNGDTVAVRHTSSSAYSATTTTTLSIGGVGAGYGSTTAAPPAVNGACGSAHTPTPLAPSAPSGGALCSAGSAGGVTAGTTAYTWGCAGSNGGTASGICSASRGYAVTPSAGANGGIGPNTPQVVAHNATPAFVAIPNSGYQLAGVSGCGGSLNGNIYTTAAIAANCAVSASFAANDTTPNAFSFTTQTGVALNAVVTSHTITVGGINTAASIGITNGQYSVNSGAWVSGVGTVNNGDTVAVRHTASGSHSTAVVTVLTLGGVTANFVSTTEAPPPPPVVEQGSRHTLSGGPYEVRANAVNGTVLTITGPTSLQLANGGGLLQAQPEPAGTSAQLAFVAGPDGVPVPRLLQGRTRLKATAPGQPLLGWLQSVPPASTVVLNAGACTDTPTELLAEVNESTGQTLITVLGCQVAWPANLPQPASTRPASSATQARAATAETAAATPALAILPGEYVVLNVQGQVQEMGLGSASGDQGLTGDAVVRQSTPGLVWLHTRPMLNGVSARLGSNVAQAVVSRLSTQAQFSQFADGGDSGQLVAKQGGKRVVLGALGRVSVDPAGLQSADWQAHGQAAHTLNLGGLSMDWAPALADTEGFARLLAEQGGSTVVQADGTLLVTLVNSSGNNGNTHFAVQAGEQLEPPTGVGGFGQTPEGVLTYTNRIYGYPQTLYPAAADFAGLRAAVLATDASGSVLGLGQGRIKLVLGGQTYTLKPEMALVPLLPQHAGKAVWLQGQPARLYLPVASLPGFAQGFAVE